MKNSSTATMYDIWGRSNILLNDKFSPEEFQKKPNNTLI